MFRYHRIHAATSLALVVGAVAACTDPTPPTVLQQQSNGSMKVLDSKSVDVVLIRTGDL